MQRLEDYIRNIPDFPEPGIQFKDITPLMKAPPMLRLAIEQLLHPFLKEEVTAIVGIEARGFIFGSLAAWKLGVAFIPLRKSGKLPHSTHSVAYKLEYGLGELEAHTDALQRHDRVLLIDDLIATGGTAAASCDLIERFGAHIIGCAFLIELDALKGRGKLAPYPVHTLIHY